MRRRRISDARRATISEVRAGGALGDMDNGERTVTDDSGLMLGEQPNRETGRITRPAT